MSRWVVLRKTISRLEGLTENWGEVLKTQYKIKERYNFKYNKAAFFINYS